MSDWAARLVRRGLVAFKREELRLLGGALAAVVLVGLFAEIAESIGAQPHELDVQLLLALRDPGDVSIGLGGPTVTSMVRDVTALGSGTLMGLFGLGLVGHLLIVRRPAEALFVTIALLGAWGLNELLKGVFDRSRPTVVPHLMLALERSFPSGHSMVAATFYPSVAAMATPLVRRRRSRVYLMLAALLISALVAGSRMYLGVHYPTDVVAGFVAGLAWALACGVGFQVVRYLVWLRRRRG